MSKLQFDARFHEWVDMKDGFYSWLIVYNTPNSPFIPDAPVSQYVEQAYASLVRNKLGKLDIRISALLRIRADLNIASVDGKGYPFLAGHYVGNNIIGFDQVRETYLVDHQTFITLDMLNHIIDLNKPEELTRPEVKTDPQLNAQLMAWRKSNLITAQYAVECAKTGAPLFSEVDYGNNPGDKPIALIDGNAVTFNSIIHQAASDYLPD